MQEDSDLLMLMYVNYALYTVLGFIITLTIPADHQVTNIVERFLKLIYE